MFRKRETDSETGRIEAFSDGVFAIAITLLVLEIKTPTHAELEQGLFHALVEKWPAFLSFFIGFFTILVCWINHHYLFKRIYCTNHKLIVVNSYILFLVSFVPFPTAVLADSFIEGDLQMAVQMFGIAYILMPIGYYLLSTFVFNDKDMTYTEKDMEFKWALKRIYTLALIHSSITIVITFFSVFLSLICYILLFGMFFFPENYVRLVLRLSKKHHAGN